MATRVNDFISTVVCAYIVYLLLCLKDPAKYYGKPKGDTIDILNIAVNADQARNVFFANLKKRIQDCRWFDGKYDATQNSIIFDKSVRVFSGHSERESFEGLNLFVAVLDEISAFALESNTGNAQANTADAVYKMYRASVDSRFPDYGKVLMLSFPRFKNDYIQQRYDAVVAEKEVVVKKYTMKLDPDLPDGIEGNEFDIEWEEDHITRYKYPRMFALKRPTWEVNPIVNIDSPAMVRAARENPADFLGRFACMPSDNVDNTFIKNKQAIEDAFVTMNGVDNEGVFLDSFQPKDDTKYYIHVDLSKVHDRCAVTMSHVDKWVEVAVGSEYHEVHPFIKVDAIRWWKPSKDKPMDYKDVTDFIVALRRRGFDIGMVTFDTWNSIDTMNFLNSQGIRTNYLSVANKHFDDLLTTLYDQRIVGPKIPELVDELKQLQYIKGKVDHPRSGFKDISDSLVGSIFNAVSRTPKPNNAEVEVMSLADMNKRAREEQHKTDEFKGVIKSPNRKIPDELKDYMSNMRLL